MATLILTRKKLFPTAFALKEFFLANSGERFFVNTGDVQARHSRMKIFRWGNSDPVNFGTEVDSSASDTIRVSSAKNALSRVLTNSGVACVRFSNSEPDIYPIVVRRTLSGMGGDGIVVCRNREEYQRYVGLHWSPWYKFSFELGVHVLGGSIARVFKKLPPMDSETEQFPIRNASRGYRFSLVSLDKYKKLPSFVDNFLSAFPVKYGRLDVGWDSVNETYRVIEFNSAPGLAENRNTLEAYGQYILEKVLEV